MRKDQYIKEKNDLISYHLINNRSQLIKHSVEFKFNKDYSINSKQMEF